MKKYICMIVSLFLPSAAHAAADEKHPFGADDWAAPSRLALVARLPKA
jgi:hypothetical protein